MGEASKLLHSAALEEHLGPLSTASLPRQLKKLTDFEVFMPCRGDFKLWLALHAHSTQSTSNTNDRNNELQRNGSFRNSGRSGNQGGVVIPMPASANRKPSSSWEVDATQTGQVLGLVGWALSAAGNVRDGK